MRYSASRCASFVWLAVGAFCLLPQVRPAYAATDVRITNMDNINLGQWDGVSDMSGNDPVCVYKSNGNDGYGVTATDNTTLTGFWLQNSTHTGQVPFTLDWSNNASPGTLAMTKGVELKASGANQSSQTCSGNVNANFSVTVSKKNLAALPAGTYTAITSFEIVPK